MNTVTSTNNESTNSVYLVCYPNRSFDDNLYYWSGSGYKVLKTFESEEQANDFANSICLQEEKSLSRLIDNLPPMICEGSYNSFSILDFELEPNFNLIEWCQAKGIEYEFEPEFVGKKSFDDRITMWEEHALEVVKILTPTQHRELWQAATGSSPAFVVRSELVGAKK